MTETIVLCEGFYDRAFWAGFLLHLGCIDRGVKLGLSRRSAVQDIRGDTVGKGQFYYYTLTGNGVRIVPCEGKTGVLSELRKLLLIQRGSEVTQIVVNVDADTNADGTPNLAAPVKPEAVENRVRAADAAATVRPDGVIRSDALDLDVVLLRWEAQDGAKPGLPNQQTLERLVCAAFVAAYPERDVCIEDWLNSRPDKQPPHSAKEYALSYMAGWYAEHGGFDFYARIWDDTALVAELQARLQASGAWQIAQMLAS